MKSPLLISLSLSCILAAGCLVHAEDQTAAKDGSVSRAEYDKLKTEHEQLKEQMAAMQAQLQKIAKQQETRSEAPASSDHKQVSHKDVAPAQSSVDELSAQVETLKQQVHETFPGSTKFLFGGYGSAYFTSRHGSDPAFSATFNPIFLFKLSDRLLFEGEAEFELEGGDTTTNLEQAQLHYLLTNYMTISAGRFLNPMNYFVERQHMGWVNKLPDKPLAVYDGLLPESLEGVHLHGVIPIGPTKVEYSAYVSNAPQLNTTASDPSSPTDVGTLNYDNFDNTDGHIAYGGHVGFIPFHQVEVGYGVQTSSVGPRNNSVHATLQTVDLNYVDDVGFLQGMVNFRAEWVWSNIGNFTYDADGSQGFGPLNFRNKREGGYAQIAYRPTKYGNDIVKNLEPVFRYDVFNQINTPTGFNEHRFTIGLNYWLAASTVFKAAYEIDSQNGTGQKSNAWLLQFVTGF